MNQLLAIGIITIVGFLGGLAAGKLKLPRITGYIIVGVLLSPSLLNIIPEDAIGHLAVITDLALGVIAYLIGGTLKAESLRGLGRSVAWITLFQSLGAWFLVTVAFALLGPLIIPGETFWQLYFPMAFIIGAISCATAPAATMAIISEYKARGPLTTTLLAVVAIDDAIAVAAFAVAQGICRPLVNETGSIPFSAMVGTPLLHIVEAAAVGVAFAAALVYISKLVRTRPLLLVVVFGAIVLCTGVTIHLGVSPILACMAIGLVVTNKLGREEMFLVVEEIEDVLYVIFFVLAGLHFDLSVLEISGILALLLVLFRCTGKYAGARAGATISRAPSTVRKYLGFALLPKAGVTVGLALFAASEFPSFGLIMLNAVLASTVLNELLAPPLTKYALFKAGEASK